MNLSELASPLVGIAIDAGQKILEVYHDESRFGEIDYKADDSPLTEADRLANERIVSFLENYWPDIPVLSEEGRDIPYEERKDWARFWLVDPLDGTKEFINRNGEFTVNIALIEGQQVVAGVVHVPVQGVTYFAAKGSGAWKYAEGAPRQQLQAASFSMDQAGLRVVCSRNHLSEATKAYINALNQPEMVNMGSSLKLAKIAEGEADVYPRFGPTMEWDIGAAQIIVEEAGGQVLIHEVGTPLQYNKENLLNPFFMVYGQRK
ncbi:MAG: 3'(2'),5'-bisphosphate nucleotidase CysQ [Bacteroidota bacterium]